MCSVVTLWLSCVAPCKEAPVYLEQNSNRPGNTGLKQGQKYIVFNFVTPQNKNKKITDKHSPVVSHIKRVEALCEALHVVGADLLQEVYVVFRVETTHVVLRCLVWLEYLVRKKL